MTDFGMPQLGQMGPLSQPLQVPAPKKKGGLFGAGKGNIGEAIAAALNGYLAAGGNQAGMMGLQQLYANRQRAADAERESQQYQQHRQDALTDYAEKQKIEAQYGRPAQPHYFEDNSGNQWAIGPDGMPKMVHKDDLPFKLVPNGLGGVVPVDLRTLMANQGAPAPQGVTFTPIDEGGPTPGGSGGFPRPY